MSCQHSSWIWQMSSKFKYNSSHDAWYDLAAKNYEGNGNKQKINRKISQIEHVCSALFN